MLAATASAQVPAAVPTATSQPQAATPEPKAPSSLKRIELNLMGGGAFSNPADVGSVQTGLGGGLEGFYMVQPWWGLGAMVGFHDFSYQYNFLTIQSAPGTVAFQNKVDLGYWDFLAGGKFRIVTGDLSPYLLGGAGVCLNNVSNTIIETATNGSSSTASRIEQGSLSKIYPELMGGLGLSLSVGQGLGLFVQGKYEWVLNEVGGASFIPVQGGVELAFE